MSYHILFEGDWFVLSCITHILLFKNYYSKFILYLLFWKTFSITRVYLTKTDVSAYTSAVVSDYKKNDPPSDYS